MNYEQTLSKAWRIVSKNKPLWVLGFFAALVVGGSKSNLGSNFVTGSAWWVQNVRAFFTASQLTTILLLLSAVVVWLFGTLARIALVREVAAVDSLQPKFVASFGRAIGAAAKSLLPIGLMQLIIWLPVLALSLLLSRVGQSLSGAFLPDAQTSAAAAAAPPSAFGTFFALGLGLAALMLVFSFIDAFAYRSILLEGVGAFQGITRAVAVIRSNLKPVLILALICLVIGVLLSFAIGLILTPLALPVLRPMMQNLTQCTQQQDYNAMLACVQQQSATPLAVVASLVLGIIGAVLSALWVAFQSVTFTLAYSRLTGVRTSNNLSGAELAQRATSVNDLPMKAKTSENKKPVQSKRRTKHR